MKKNVLTIMSALILVCCFFIYHFSKELLIQNSHQVPQSQINKKISAERNTQQNKIYRVMKQNRVFPEAINEDHRDNTNRLKLDPLYTENSLLELNEFYFDQNFIKSDNIILYEYESEVYYRGLSGNLLCYDGTETHVILNESITNLYGNCNLLTCLLEEKEEIVILDLKEKQYNSFQYTLPFSKEDCYLGCLYHIANDSFTVYNLTDRDYLYVLENGVLTKMLNEVSNVDYPMAAYFEIEDSSYRLYNRDASCDLYENNILIDSSISDLQVVDTNIYYLKNMNECGGYLVENYLMKYDVQSKEITKITNMPVISFLATETGIYYSLDPTCFKKKPTGVENADELRMKENQGVYYSSNQGKETKISNDLYSGFQVCQYGLMAVTPREDRIELHLIDDPLIILDTISASSQNVWNQYRWKYNENF